jgi:hypothetical protein
MHADHSHAALDVTTMPKVAYDQKQLGWLLHRCGQDLRVLTNVMKRPPTNARALTYVPTTLLTADTYFQCTVAHDQRQRVTAHTPSLSGASVVNRRWRLCKAGGPYHPHWASQRSRDHSIADTINSQQGWYCHK